MTGWNLPPGCNVSDLPGYWDVECQFCEQTIDERYGCDCPQAVAQRQAAEDEKLP